MSVANQQIVDLNNFRCRVRKLDNGQSSLSFSYWRVHQLFLQSCRCHNVFIKPKHWQIFVTRPYWTTEEIDRAVRRYKVFGDLGFGAR